MGIRDGNGVADVDITRIREDFKCIFDLHKYTVNRIRPNNANSGDFFNIGVDDDSTTTEIEISLQGTPDAINRLAQGISVPEGLVKAYVEYTTDVQPQDLIEFNGIFYKINNFSDGIKSGLIGFREFDLQTYKQIES